MFNNTLVPASNSVALSNLTIRALNSSGTFYGTGSIKELTGGNYITSNLSTGTVTSGIAMRAQIQNLNAGSVMTNAYAFRAGDIQNSGTIVNTYGVYCGIQKAGTQTNVPYAFYNEDPDSINYFAGATKRRVTSAADATSITPDTRYCDITYQPNTQAVGTLTINADTGVVSVQPFNGQAWMLKIKSTNIQTFAWNAMYVGGSAPLPTTTTGASKIDYYSFVYDAVNSKWHFTGNALGY
jgi:phage terminase large subunit-like protein